MDKKKPSHDLKIIKDLIENDQYFITQTALATANSLGFSETQMMETILLLNRRDFFKSTTDIKNPKIWHDVYKTQVSQIPLYIKIILKDSGVIVTSFK